MGRKKCIKPGNSSKRMQNLSDSSGYRNAAIKIDRIRPAIWMMERAGKKNGNNKDWQFWQQHNKPTEIKDQEMFDKTLDYIPVRMALAGRA